MSRLDTARRKLLRRCILELLRAAHSVRYEGWMAERSIFNQVGPVEDSTFAEVQAELKYLRDAGLIADEERRETKFDAHNPSYRILPSGIDLLDETVPPVPGVEDNRL